MTGCEPRCIHPAGSSSAPSLAFKKPTQRYEVWFGPASAPKPHKLAEKETTERGNPRSRPVTFLCGAEQMKIALLALRLKILDYFTLSKCFLAHCFSENPSRGCNVLQLVHLLGKTGASVVFLVVLFRLPKYLGFEKKPHFIKVRLELWELPANKNTQLVSRFFFSFFLYQGKPEDSGAARSPEPAVKPCWRRSQVLVKRQR